MPCALLCKSHQPPPLPLPFPASPFLLLPQCRLGEMAIYQLPTPPRCLRNHQRYPQFQAFSRQRSSFAAASAAADVDDDGCPVFGRDGQAQQQQQRLLIGARPLTRAAAAVAVGICPPTVSRRLLHDFMQIIGYEGRNLFLLAAHCGVFRRRRLGIITGDFLCVAHSAVGVKPD